MRQLFLDKGIVKLHDVCQPLLDDYSVLVKVHYSCISPGTEGATIATASENNSMLTNIPSKLSKVLLSLKNNGIEGTKALLRERFAGTVTMLGYSCAGEVIAAGKKVTHLRVGDLVACAGAGFANHADLVVVPENLVVQVHDKEHLAHASMTTLGAIALQGVRRTLPQLGETIAVIGLGLLGQITVQLLKQSGCRVIGIDINADRLQLAKKLGADSVMHPTDNEAKKEIEFMTKHYGVDASIITAGSKSSDIIQQAMEITRKKGRVVLVGDVGLDLERSPLYQKEIDFLISCSYGPGRYDDEYEKKGHDYPYAYVRWTENRNMQAFLQLVEGKKIDLSPLVTDIVSFEKAEEAYERLNKQQALSIILSLQEQTDSEKDETTAEQKNEAPLEKREEIRFIPAYKDSLRIGVVGAGGFARVKLMPIISRIKHLKINAIVDANIANSITLSKVYGAAKALSNDKDLFDEDVIDAVLIASPHKYHCDQALAALRNGKAVFLEKPMVTDFEQLEKMREFFKQHDKVPFCVDYNRSFSPFMRKIKKVVDQRNSPLIIHYRMNAGFVPKDHWIQSDVGAGRIIGEACHIFDLFYFLVGSWPVSVSVESIKPSSEDIFPTDNFSVQFSFADGSLCSLLYTALGHQTLGKERMEVFFDSKTILMDDYKLLQGYGLPKSFNETVMVQDKGHEQLLKTFFDSIRYEHYKPPIKLEHLDKVAEVTLIIDQLVCQGGGEKTIS